MSDGEHLLIERLGACLELTLNRPEKLNALTNDLIRALTRAFLDAAEDDTIRSIMLTGAGRGFCAGQDLGKRNPDGEDWQPDLRASITENYAPLIASMQDLPKPIVCAVNGVAAGAGANLALACDIVIAADSAKFIQSFSKVGLIPDAGGTWILPKLVGHARAKALCLTGTPVAADLAADWGMIWKSLPGKELMTETRALAASLSEGPTLALGMTKLALNQSAKNSLQEQFETEATFQGRAGHSSDYEEGVRAFLKKRATIFCGW